MPPSIAEVHAALTAPGQMFEMEEVEIRGIPTRTWKHAPPSLRAVLEQSRAHGDLDFLVYEDEALTFAEHFAAVATLAHRLVDDFGVRKGDRVAIAMRNFPEWSVAFWAAAAAGAVVVPLNAWWTGPELEYGLERLGLGRRCSSTRSEHERLDRPPRERFRTSRGMIVAKAERRHRTAGALRFEDVLGDVDPPTRSCPTVEIDPEDDATIFYTSGTTGQPEGRARHASQHLHEPDEPRVRVGAIGGPLRSRRRPPRPGAGEQNAYLLSVPFFHATGCHSVLVANLAFGGKIVIMYKWDAGRALELIERERITTFGGVPAMVWQVLDHPDFATRDISSVQLDRLRRRARGARARAPHRGDVPRPYAEQRLRPDRDVVGDDDELGRRLPAQARERRRARRRCAT